MGREYVFIVLAVPAGCPSPWAPLTLFLGSEHLSPSLSEGRIFSRPAQPFK